MNRFMTSLSIITATLVLLSASASAGSLDDYYLQQFNESGNVQLQKAVLSTAAEIHARCGMPLKHGLSRDWKMLEQSTQKVLAKQLAQPVLTNEAVYPPSGGGHFKIHYTASGTGAPDITAINQYTGMGLTSTADWAKTVYDTLEYIYSQYSIRGYLPAPTPTGTYDIYLNNQASQGYYGVTTDNFSAIISKTYPNSVSSWIELDSSFTNPIYHPDTYTPLQSLQITAAHEYQHAIQYGYNYYFDIWYAEATSTWMEDELYDNINQLYTYIPAWFSNSATSLDLAVDQNATSTGAGYGRWIFNRYLAEKHSPAMIRGVWEGVGGFNSPNGTSDIPMIPVLESVLSSATYNTSLGADFFAFAKRVYKRDWSSHTTEINKIHLYSPKASFAAHPSDSTAIAVTPSVNLPHYSFAYYNITPALGVTSLSISVSKDSGIQTALFKNGSEVAANSSGSAYSTYSVSGLGTTDTAVLLIANASGSDNQTASFSTDGKLVVTSGTVTPSASSGTSSGCFIATAAYGSYLHPQVQLLRNFRDRHLLTNRPGRAFVTFYYRYSPPLADFIAHHAALRGLSRLALTPLIIAVVHPYISAATIILLFCMVQRSWMRRKRTATSGNSATLSASYPTL